MTVDECAARAFDHCLSYLGGGLTGESKRTAFESIHSDLRALLYTESVRAAGMLRETANSDEVTSMCCSDDTGNLLDALAANILSTSPGKVGG